MNVLVLNPGARLLDFALVVGAGSRPALSGRVADYRGAAASRRALKSILKSCRQGAPAAAQPRAWAVRIPFGGELFTRPVRLSRDVMRSLESLAPLAPLHLPAILELLAALRAERAGRPVILVFETAFFAKLPRREASYALEAGLMDAGALRRFGYHGLFHAAACAHAARLCKARGMTAPPRIVSICLEPRPEVAAVLRDRPVMVTGGLTPLEGLPGQTTCGELDPGIIIALRQQTQWGPERINAILTRESGLLGLANKRVTLDQVLGPGPYEGSLAQELMNYRLLLACGAGIAALGGLNQIVFSGRYAGLGERLGPELVARLSGARGAVSDAIACDIFATPLERVIADQAGALLLAVRAGR